MVSIGEIVINALLSYERTFYLGDLDEYMSIENGNIPESGKPELELLLEIFKFFRSCNTTPNPGLGNYRTYKKDNPHFEKMKVLIESKIQKGIDKKYPSFTTFTDELDGGNSLFDVFVETYDLEDHESSLYWAYDTCSFKKVKG